MRPRWPSRRRAREPQPRYQIVEVIGASEQLDEAVGRAAERIVERRTSGAGGSRGGLRTLALLVAAVAGTAAAGYAAARALLGRDLETRPLPGPLDGATGEVRAARDALEAGIAEGRRASIEAERDLHEDLQRRRQGNR
ncbi:MAG: hypothetical protein F4X76_00165 [Chloroflexi bacterium]|nr:hypothetical protein [Chloroflexota bacterium]